MYAPKCGGGVILLAANNDIVEMSSRGQTYWVSCRLFKDVVEISIMLEEIISARSSLITIQHIFDDASGMEDTRTRFACWRKGVQEKHKPKSRKKRGGITRDFRSLEIGQTRAC
jgi:hypothetical protein